MHPKLFNKNLNDLLKNIYPERKDLNKISEDIANIVNSFKDSSRTVSYTHLRAHET